MPEKCIHGKSKNGYYCKMCPGKGICEHNNRKSICKSCGGNQICQHNKHRSHCRECGGSAFCEHNRQRQICRDCNGSSICQHNRERSKCTECHGKSVCEHNRQRSKCTECHGKSVCEHNRQRYHCVDCKGSGICEHNKRRNRCKNCEGSSICQHNVEKYLCKLCGGAAICIHNRVKYTCVECGGSQICEHNTRRSICKICVGSQICQHNRIRSECRDCDGSAFCQHDKRRAQCIDCHGSHICQHDKQKHQCTECRRNMPIEEILRRYKKSCVICGKQLRSLKHQLERLCPEHSSECSKRPEHYWREILIKEFNFEPSTIDQIVHVTDDCKGEKYRPDLTYIDLKLVLALEFDEHSHEDYLVDCELKRLVNLKDAYPNHKLLVIRMNPNVCRVVLPDLSDFTARTNYMVEVMRQYLENQEELDERVTNVIYLFYGKSGRDHIDASLKNIDRVKVIDTLFCDL